MEELRAEHEKIENKAAEGIARAEKNALPDPPAPIEIPKVPTEEEAEQ